jgi:hypothetical protein
MRYFFDIRDDQLVPDEEGMILPDIEAAQEEATRTLTDLVREAMRAESAGGMTIEVRSQHGPVLEASLTWRFDRQIVSPLVRLPPLVVITPCGTLGG